MSESITIAQYRAQAKPPKRRNKYGAIKATVSGLKFDSRREARHYAQLDLLRKAGAISCLEVHPAFPIVINGIKVCTVILDFSYLDRATGKRVYVDVKGGKATMTPLSRLKHKLLTAALGIPVTIA